MKKALLSVSVLIVGVVIVISLFPSEKKRVKKIIMKCGDAVAAEDIDALMEHVSFHYSDKHGGSYLRVKNAAESAFNSFDDFDLEIDIMSINIQENKADADVKVSLIVSDGATRGYLLGDAGGLQDVHVSFEKDPYEWKVIRINGVFEHTGQESGNR